VTCQHVGVGQACPVAQSRRLVGGAAHWRRAKLERFGTGRIDGKAGHGQLRLKGRQRRASLSMSPWRAPGVESMQAPARRIPSPGAAVALCLRCSARHVRAAPTQGFASVGGGAAGWLGHP